MPTPFDLPPTLREMRNYVDGEFVSTERRFPDRSPLHGQVLGMVHEADAASRGMLETMTSCESRMTAMLRQAASAAVSSNMRW